MTRDYLKRLSEQVLIFDGSMGANLQDLELTADDFGGDSYHGCMDALCLTRPDVPAVISCSLPAAAAPTCGAAGMSAGG